MVLPMLLGLRTYLKLAGELGLGPRLTGPKPVVLPLDDSPMNKLYH